MRKKCTNNIVLWFMFISIRVNTDGKKALRWQIFGNSIWR